MTIRSFGDERTEMLFESRHAPHDMTAAAAHQARRLMLQLDAAEDVDLLRTIPSFRNLRPGEDGLWSVPLVDGWRLRFLWRDAHAWFVRLDAATTH